MTNRYIITGPATTADGGYCGFDRLDIVEGTAGLNENGNLFLKRPSDGLVQYVSAESLFKIPTEEEGLLRLDFKTPSGGTASVLITNFADATDLLSVLEAIGSTDTFFRVLSAMVEEAA